MTVRELIEQLSAIEDQGRRVVVAGFSTPDARPALVGRYSRGQVIIWDADDLMDAEHKAGRRIF